MKGLIVVAALAMATAASAAKADPQTELRTYFSSMSWPVRASVLRAQSVGAAIDGFLSPGDPPFLRGVAGRCRSLRAIEPRGRLLRVVAPARLETSHRSLARAYAKMRDECKQARVTALAVGTARDRFSATGSAEDEAAWHRAEAVAHESLPRFERRTLGSFTRAARTWRLAALRQAAALGLPPPRWLKELGVGP